MSRKAKIIIAISAAVVVLLVLCTHASFHWTKEMTSCNSTSGSTWSEPSGDRLRLLRTIAIVAPRAKSADVRLGGLIAGKLKERLSAKDLARDIRRGAHSWTTGSPAVTVYQTAAEARRAKPDFYFTIRPKAYRYSFFPFARNWSATVSIDGSPSGVHTNPTVVSDRNGRYGYYDADFEFNYEGKIIGIFTPSYLTSKVADEVAQKVADDVEKATKHHTDEFLHPKKED